MFTFKNRDLLNELRTDNRIQQPRLIQFSTTGAIAYYDGEDTPTVHYDALADLLMEHTVDPDALMARMEKDGDMEPAEVMYTVINAHLLDG